MRTTAFLIAVLLALASVSTTADARKHHRQPCVAPDARTMNNLAIAGWASLFVGWPVNVWATSAADAGAKQVLACAKAKKR